MRLVLGFLYPTSVPLLPPSEPRIQVTSSRAMVDAAARRSVDRALLLADHQLNEATLADPDAPLPASHVHALWLDAVARSDEPQLPVLAAMELPWGAYRVIDSLYARAETFGDAIRLLSKVFGIVNDAVQVTIEPFGEGGAAMVLHRADGGDVPAMYADYALTACVCRMRTVIGDAGHPTDVRLRRPVPTDPAAHQRAFGPDVRFDPDCDAAFYDAATLAIPTLTPDPGLREVLHRHAEALLATLPTVDPLVEQIRRVLRQGLPHGHSELARVAKALDTSPRTLQRRLSALGVTWSDLITETRFTLAKAHLAEHDLSVEEVGLLVGYSDPSSFHRAFVRWIPTSVGRPARAVRCRRRPNRRPRTVARAGGPTRANATDRAASSRASPMAPATRGDRLASCTPRKTRTSTRCQST